MSASDFEWSRSSICANGACVEVARAGRVVLVQDSKAPASGGGVMQAYDLPEWSELISAIKAGATFHSAIEFLPTGEVWLGFQHAARHEILRFDLDEWDAFVSGVRRGEFDIDKLSGPAVGAQGVPAGQVGSDTGVGADRAATGAGVSGNPPAPVAAEWVPGLNGAPIDVPAGRLTGAPASLSPQEAGQPGPAELLDLVRPDFLTGVDVDEWARDWAWAAYGVGFDAGLRVAAGEVDEAREWARCTAPLVPEVVEASRGGTAVATGGAPPDRAGVSGGKAGPGSTLRAPGPADTAGGAS